MARKVDGREADVARLNQAGQYLFPRLVRDFLLPVEPSLLGCKVYLLSERHIMSEYLFTSESVSEGHPDKVADH